MNASSPLMPSGDAVSLSKCMQPVFGNMVTLLTKCHVYCGV